MESVFDDEQRLLEGGITLEPPMSNVSKMNVWGGLVKERLTKVEHAGAVSLLDVVAWSLLLVIVQNRECMTRDNKLLTFFHGNLASAHFIHSDTDETHEADVRVVCLNEDDGSVIL